MRYGLLADSPARIGDYNIVAAMLKVRDELGPDVLLGFAVVDDDEPRGESVRPKHFVKLAHLVSGVVDHPAVERDGLAKDLCAGLSALVDHVILGEARQRRGRYVPKVLRAKPAPILGKIRARSADSVEDDRRRSRPAEDAIIFRLKLLASAGKLTLASERTSRAKPSSAATSPLCSLMRSSR